MSTARPHSAQRHTSAQDIGASRILVVDDNESLRSLVKLTLERGLRPAIVDEAVDGFEALRKAEATPPDLIVLDVMMPGLDGFEVCKRLRANLKTAATPVILLTACEDAESKRLGFLSGIDDYVAKPFKRSELVALARRLLERRSEPPRSASHAP